jgi:hypothetical protein
MANPDNQFLKRHKKLARKKNRLNAAAKAGQAKRGADQAAGAAELV